MLTYVLSRNYSNFLQISVSIVRHLRTRVNISQNFYLLSKIYLSRFNYEVVTVSPSKANGFFGRFWFIISTISKIKCFKCLLIVVNEHPKTERPLSLTHQFCKIVASHVEIIRITPGQCEFIHRKLLKVMIHSSKFSKNLHGQLRSKSCNFVLISYNRFYNYINSNTSYHFCSL